ncbi:hypothetical protein [Streptomyces durhamensis]|uniref:hypothetical protein n=1 Tax=Streptomyces durhamensis TaxID=68194 RepID=UPI0004CDBF03|nr:hypothetical protein [Streptomyces durhamensis]
MTSPSPDPVTPEAGDGDADVRTPAGGAWELPSAADIQKYDTMLGGGAAERALSLVEKRFALEVEDQYQRRLDAEHRRRLDMINVRFRIAGVVVGASGFGGCLWIAKDFVDRGATTQAAGLLGGMAAALSAIFLGTRSRTPR